MDLWQDKPLVSVGIPTYNNPEGLRRTLQCMTSQTYKKLEIIVSDNCSPGKGVQEVVQEFLAKDLRIQYYRQSENKGPFLNLAFVLKKATGDYFMWAADDDEWEENFVETGVKALLENDFYQAWFCSYDEVDMSGRLVQEVSNYSSLTSTPNRRKNIIRYLRASDIPGKDCMTYAIYERAALLDTVGRYFLGDRVNHYGCDSAFNIAFLTKYNILIAEEILFHKMRKTRKTGSVIDQKDEVVPFKGNSSYRGASPNRSIFPLKKLVSILREHYKAVEGTPYTRTVILTIISILPRAIKNYLIIRANRKANSVAKRVKALIQYLYKI
jgi:glycosyltransferase involved in cell wall biosynthesis